jgi:hypothetical protein
MENEIAFLKTEEGLEFKLTSDKLFITSATGTEAFALRSINGIGVLDLVENYNDVLANSKRVNTQFTVNAIACFVGAGGILLMGIYMKSLFVGFIAAALVFAGLWFRSLINRNDPEMKSCVRLMLNGMNREFIFNKRKTSSIDVANFVARVEDTLTAFHKNQ